MTVVTLEYLLHHGEECVQRLNSAEAYLATARPEVLQLRADLQMAEETIRQLQHSRTDLKARAALREEQLQAELTLARRSFLKRLLNTA